MKNTIIIKKNYEFKNLFSKGKFYYGEFVHLYIKQNNLTKNKFAIAVSKKQGKAVKRNHIKRIIRESYKNLEDNIKEGNSILVVINKNKSVEDISYNDIKTNMMQIFKKANLLK